MIKFNDHAAFLIKRAVDSGITSPNELANFMANAHVETAGFTRMEEDLRYTTRENLVRNVSSATERFSHIQIDDAIASKSPQKIAAIMYENRDDLGNTEAGDGYRFRGRGYFQFTGRDNYRRFGKLIGEDLVSDPDKAADPEVSASLAIEYWLRRVSKLSKTNVRMAAKDINGGRNGLDQRTVMSQKLGSILDEDLIRMIQEGEHGIDELRRRAEATQGHTRPNHGDLLKTHSHGPAVEKLQSDLNTLGHTSLTGQPLVEDGHFGPATAHAVRSFQASHALTPDGIAGPATQRALRDNLTQHRERETNPTVQLTDTCHPAHAMYLQAREHVYRLDAQHHREPDQRSDNLAAALTAASAQAGMVRIDQLTLGDNAQKVWATQRQTSGQDHFFDLHACVDTVAALDTPLRQSSDALAHMQAAELAQRTVEPQQHLIDHEPARSRQVMRH